jgi:CS domain
LDLVIPVPKGTRAKDLSVVIAKKKLSVCLKGKDKILDGELCQEVKLDDSTWTLRKCSRQKSLVPHPT